jgi:hypothetical protein
MSAPEAGATSSTSAREFAGQVQERGREARGQTQGFIRSQLDERSTQTGTRVRSTADDIRSVAKELRNQGKEGPANLADQVAGPVEGLGEYLADSDPDRMMNDLEEFARRQPWLIGLASLGVGFAAARFLRASSTRRRDVRSADPGIERPTPKIADPQSSEVGIETPTGTETSGAPITFPESIDEPESQRRPGMGA